jgi:hypothetical protein
LAVGVGRPQKRNKLEAAGPAGRKNKIDSLHSRPALRRSKILKIKPDSKSNSKGWE